MKKYFRTEYDIFEFYKFIDNIIVIKVNYDSGYACLASNPQIFKEADTIEELCDEFVVIEETQNYAMEICSSYEVLKDNGWIGSNFTIYGAIWTDKGLIYVAKMNEKGELELL